jgi:hypothetical protein
LYDPVIGRFSTADNIIPQVSNPIDINRYSYCRNKPNTYVDPDGHNPVGIAIGATTGAISGLIAGLQEGNATAAVMGGIVGGVVGAVVGSLAPTSAPAAAMAAFGALSSVFGGIAGRGTVASITSEGENTGMATFTDAFNPSDIAIDALTGTIAGFGGSLTAIATKGASGSLTAVELTASNISISANFAFSTLESIVSEPDTSKESDNGHNPNNDDNLGEDDGFNL